MPERPKRNEEVPKNEKELINLAEGAMRGYLTKMKHEDATELLRKATAWLEKERQQEQQVQEKNGPTS